MLFFNLGIIPFLIWFIVLDFVTHLAFTWIFLGDSILLLALCLSLISITKHKPKLATNFFLGTYVNVFFTFCIADYFFPDVQMLEEILITTLVLIVALNVFSVMVLERNHLILHGLMCNLCVILHYLYILWKSEATKPEQFELLISSLLLLNLSIFLAWNVYNSYHNLILSTEEGNKLIKVIEGFIPICANCKAI